MAHKVDYKFISCATCQYWSGNVNYKWPGLVEVDDSQQLAPCNNMFLGRDTYVWASCSRWEPKFKI